MTDPNANGEPVESSTGSTRSSSNPVEQILALLGSIDPIDLATRAVDTSRRSTEALLTILESFAGTVDNLNRTTVRINSLLDEVEEPLRRVMPQVGAAMNAMATMGEATIQMADLAKRLSPLAALAENAGGLFGLRQKASPGSAETTNPS